MAKNIFKMLDEVIEKIREENVTQVITNNTTNYEVAKLSIEKRKKLYWTSYTAHYIVLMLEDFKKKLNTCSVIIAKA